tara:strand:+ start:908 stop:1321 length:414 start_codon:yes stop_codon:yes gene_type:complete
LDERSPRSAFPIADDPRQHDLPKEPDFYRGYGTARWEEGEGAPSEATCREALRNLIATGEGKPGDDEPIGCLVVVTHPIEHRIRYWITLLVEDSNSDLEPEVDPPSALRLVVRQILESGVSMKIRTPMNGVGPGVDP